MPGTLPPTFADFREKYTRAGHASAAPAPIVCGHDNLDTDAPGICPLERSHCCSPVEEKEEENVNCNFNWQKHFSTIAIHPSPNAVNGRIRRTMIFI